MKSVDQKLYEALRSGTGCLLTYEDVFNLVVKDDAVSTRIGNQISIEAVGHEDAGVSWGDYSKTWSQLVKEAKKNWTD